MSSGFRGIPTPLKCLLCWRRLMITASAASQHCPLNAGGLQTTAARRRKVEEHSFEHPLLAVQWAVDVTLVPSTALGFKKKKKKLKHVYNELFRSLSTWFTHVVSEGWQKQFINVGNLHGRDSHMTHSFWLHMLSDCCSSFRFSWKCRLSKETSGWKQELVQTKSLLMKKAGGRMLP